MDQPTASLGEAAASPLSVLEAEKARLENAVAKLKQSNADLRAAADAEDDEDEKRTYRQAINENLPVIAKYVARAEALGEEIQRCKGGGIASEPERMAVEDEGGAPPPPPPPPQAPGDGEGVWL